MATFDSSGRYLRLYRLKSVILDREAWTVEGRLEQEDNGKAGQDLREPFLLKSAKTQGYTGLNLPPRLDNMPPRNDPCSRAVIWQKWHILHLGHVLYPVFVPGTANRVYRTVCTGRYVGRVYRAVYRERVQGGVYSQITLISPYYYLDLA